MTLQAESVLEPHPVELSELGKRVPKDLVCGRNHTVLLTTCGRVYSWGAAGFGRYVRFTIIEAVVDICTRHWSVACLV